MMDNMVQPRRLARPRWPCRLAEPLGKYLSVAFSRIAEKPPSYLPKPNTLARTRQTGNAANIAVVDATRVQAADRATRPIVCGTGSKKHRLSVGGHVLDRQTVRNKGSYLEIRPHANSPRNIPRDRQPISSNLRQSHGIAPIHPPAPAPLGPAAVRAMSGITFYPGYDRPRRRQIDLS